MTVPFDPVKAKERQRIMNAKQVNLREFSNILVVAPYNLEDFILSTPAIAALKEALPPEGKLTALITGDLREIAAGCSFIDRALVMKTLNPVEAFKSMMSVFSTKFEIIINLNSDLYTAVVLSLITKAKARVAYADKNEKVLYNAIHNLTLRTIDQPQHKIIKYLNLVRFIGANSYDFTPKFSVSEKDIANAKEFLARKGIGSHDILVGIHPSVAHKGKRWSISKFAQLANNLMDKYGVKVLAFSNREEKDRLHEFDVVTKKKTIMVDTHEYMKMAAISRFLCCYVCNEDDLMHVFAPFTNTVAIWGDTDPEVNKPSGPGNEVIVPTDGNADSVPVSKVTEIIKQHLPQETRA